MLSRFLTLFLVLAPVFGLCSVEDPPAKPAKGQSSQAIARGSILSDVPSRIEPGGRYLIYLHGRIVETEGERPTHPDFGIYEYRMILETFADLGSGHGAFYSPHPAWVEPTAEWAGR